MCMIRMSLTKFKHNTDLLGRQIPKETFTQTFSNVAFNCLSYKLNFSSNCFISFILPDPLFNNSMYSLSPYQ